ncbi:hypothetical protein V5N11_002993 [Cardamine amara subsp. amara]|uniref:NYN domain-containing protein n=1 Tax=Cardamine amara subsp. amara TaxID=228776 RepID=A0ABD0ZVW9_CARAN
MTFHSQAKPEYAKSETMVWWDINSCPIPDGYDAGRVSPSIESALKNLGYSGPITITVFGNLEYTSAYILQRLSSTGIHVIHGLDARSILFDLLLGWQDDNPPPCSMMLISDKVDEFSMTLCRQQQIFGGYNLLLAYTSIPKYVSFLVTSAEWLWKSLLGADEMNSKQETRRHSVLHKCSETDEMDNKQQTGRDSLPRFVCTSCGFLCEIVERFTNHISREEHAQSETMLKISKMRDPEFEKYSTVESEDEEECVPNKKQKKGSE